MFVLSEIKDTISVTPNTFALETHIAIQDAINHKFSNKLIPSVGLALGVYDILTCGEGKIRWGDGLLFYKVTFRLVVFSPFQGENLIGTIYSSTEQHIRVTLGFFTDIYIPKRNLPANCCYDHKEKAWFWIWAEEGQELPEDLNDTEPETRLYYDVRQPIKLRVESLDWQEVEPLPPSQRDRPPAFDPLTGDIIEPSAEEVEMKERKKERDANYKVIGSVVSEGLGCPAWWGPDEPAPQEEPAAGPAAEDYPQDEAIEDNQIGDHMDDQMEEYS